MNVAQKNKQTTVFLLTITSVIMSVLFSVLGAPFLRALANSAKPIVFWTAGLLLTIALFTQNMTLVSIYIGAIWMTLGIYTELEKRGINWKKSGLVSLVSGFVFATIIFKLTNLFFVDKNVISEFLLPLQTAMNKAFPEDPIEISVLAFYVPGIFMATLFIALALGFILEQKINQLFHIQRTKVASGLRWLEFRLPDAFIWISLFAGFFSLVSLNSEILQKIGLNIIIFSAVAFFFQGIVITEFLMRAFRVGSFTKTILYIVILIQLTPAIMLLGLIDYWVDFRKRARKKIKAN